MDHLHFKSEQTAAAYVGDALDPETRDAFELHMMSCHECVEEVESWRAIKSCMPRDAVLADIVRAAEASQRTAAPRGAGQPAVLGIPADSDSCGSAQPSVRATSAQSAPGQANAMAPSATPRSISATAMRWRVAASLAAGVVIGIGGGWYGRSTQAPPIDGTSIAFYSLPPLTRGPTDCTAVPIDSHMALVALRVPGATREQQLIPVDSEGHDLAPDRYSVRPQGDGSWLVRLPAQAVRDQGIRFEARSADGTVEPRGCILSGTPG
jgi:hypothetical protein